MNKFEFVLNNDLVTDICKNKCSNIDPLKFDIIAGNTIFLKGNLYEEISLILTNFCNTNFKETTFFPDRSNIGSACRRYLKMSTYYNVPSIRYNFEDQAMIYSKIDFTNGHEYSMIDRYDNILGLESVFKILIEYRILRENENQFRNRLLSEIFSYEDATFFDLLKSQSPLVFTVDNRNRIHYFLENMVRQLNSKNLRPECFLLHPNLRSLAYSNLNSMYGSPGFLYGIPVHFSTLLDNNEIYLLSNNLGQMCMFNDVEFIRNDRIDLAAIEITIRERFNIIMTNNFCKVRIE